MSADFPISRQTLGRSGTVKFPIACDFPDILKLAFPMIKILILFLSSVAKVEVQHSHHGKFYRKSYYSNLGALHHSIQKLFENNDRVG